MIIRHICAGRLVVSFLLHKQRQWCVPEGMVLKLTLQRWCRVVHGEGQRVLLSQGGHFESQAQVALRTRLSALVWTAALVYRFTKSIENRSIYMVVFCPRPDLPAVVEV
jgi:hypothetical protein